MSYEPTLILKIEDLQKHESLFEKSKYNLPDEHTRGGEENKTLLETIMDLYFEDDKYIVDVFGVKCRYFKPLYSSYNREIREKLDELQINYICIGG